jgi:hypothetical protein
MFGVSLGIIDSGGAGGGVASFEPIQTVTTSASQATVSFTSIPSTYKHLQLRIHARSNRASSDTTAVIRFNSDSGANYNNHRLYGNGSTVSADGNTNETRVMYLMINAVGATTASYSPYIVDIHDYASTTKNKTARAIGGKDNNDTDGYIFLQSGAWRNTAAITTIELIDVISTFVNGSVISLYGIKG